jgi:hypothetical protein
MESVTQTEPTLEQQLAQARQQLDIMYHEFYNILGTSSHPDHYIAVNARSREIADKTAEVCTLEQRILKLARSALNN